MHFVPKGSLAACTFVVVQRYVLPPRLATRKHQATRNRPRRAGSGVWELEARRTTCPARQLGFSAHELSVRLLLYQIVAMDVEHAPRRAHTPSVGVPPLSRLGARSIGATLTMADVRSPDTIVAGSTHKQQ